MGLEIGYMTLNFAMFILVIFMGKMAIETTFTDEIVVRKKLRQLIIPMALWQIYIYYVASTGFLQDFSLPPRFLLLLVLPAFLFIAIFLYKNKSNAWIMNIPASALIYIQAFRILVETLFVYSVAKGVLHENVTIEGYNYDMILAFTAPIVAFLVFDKKLFSIKFAIAWNYLGLAVLVSVIFVFVTTVYFPGLYGSEVTLMPIEFAKYPYVLVAGFLMPLAVFFHILSIVQLRRRF